MSNANEMIDAVGAMAELLALLRDNLIQQGFTRAEALQLTQAYMVQTFLGGGKNGQANE